MFGTNWHQRGLLSATLVCCRFVGRLLVLAAGVVKVAQGGASAISAYVALSAGTQSRVFHVSGAVDTPRVDELPARTTLDLQRFRSQLQDDLQPALDDARARGKQAHIELSRPEWICVFVRDHLKATEGIDVD
jgi:hypothetical protein